MIRCLGIPSAALLAAIATTPASSVVVRHDVPDADAIAAATETPFSAVGLLEVNGVSAGSGTLIAPRWVLTAAHVAEAGHEQGWSFVLQRTHHAVDRVIVHHGWSGRIPDVHDVALMRLRRPIPGVTPAVLHRGRLATGDAVVLAGCGATGQGRGGYSCIDLEPRAVTNAVDGWLGPFPLMRFDPPRSPRATAREGMAAPLDSGGGLFVPAGARWRLAAVHAFVEDASNDGRLGTYGDLHGVTPLAPILPWIERHLPPRTLGDLNGDGRVDGVDLVLIMLDWGDCPIPPLPCDGDTNSDGAVDVLDLIEAIGADERD